jgi:diketogulonate reductase-like aldo/keto reductase
MMYREFGKTNFKTSVIGMGTFYDAFWIASAMLLKFQGGRSKKLEALRVGLDSGINFIDSAEIYQSETIVRDAIQGRKRDELFIASKVWSNHLRSDKVEKSCRGSLSKLNTPYIDLYQIHFPSPRVPISETMGAMEKLVDQGFIRNIGVSNFSFAQMREAESALKKYELISTQMHYNLTRRDVEREILPHCEKEKIAMIPYYPLAHGKLARSAKSEAIVKICKNHRGVSFAQVALAWLTTRSPLNFPIPRASNSAHVKDNASAGEVVLSPDEMKSLESV